MIAVCYLLYPSLGVLFTDKLIRFAGDNSDGLVHER